MVNCADDERPRPLPAGRCAWTTAASSSSAAAGCATSRPSSARRPTWSTRARCAPGRASTATSWPRAGATRWRSSPPRPSRAPRSCARWPRRAWAATSPGAGELVHALAAGIDPARIYLHGNAKTDEDLERAIDAGVGTVVIDNLDDVDRLERLVRGEQGVLVRVIPGVRPDTHAAVATGQDDSKFGLAPGRRAPRRSSACAARTGCASTGCTSTSARRSSTPRPSGRRCRRSPRSASSPSTTSAAGSGARYTYADRPPSVAEYLDVLVGAAREHLPAGARLVIEPGRSLVARAGVTLYRVVTVKRGARTFVAVDGGMGDNLEVSLYGQRFEATVADRVGGGEQVDLVGRHCESGDVLSAGVALREPRVGDVVAVPATGAYCFTMRNGYNGALPPAGRLRARRRRAGRRAPRGLRRPAAPGRLGRGASGGAPPADLSRGLLARAARRASSPGSIPGGPRISMPCSGGDARQLVGRRAAQLGGVGAADGADEGLEAGRGRGHEPARVASPTRSVCGTPRGARMQSPARRTCISSPAHSVSSPSRT